MPLDERFPSDGIIYFQMLSTRVSATMLTECFLKMTVLILLHVWQKVEA